MITREEAITGLYAAWRLFLRDRRAVALFDDSYSGVVKSFFCAAIVFPGYILLYAFGPNPVPADVGLFRLTTVNLIAYVMSWVIWPLALAYIAPAIDRGDEYYRYVVAANWAGGPQVAIFLLVLLLALTGIASKGVMDLVSLAALVVVLIYHLFILRVVLRVSLFMGIGLLVANFMLSEFVILMRTVMLK